MMRSQNGLYMTLVGLSLWLLPLESFAEVTRHHSIEGFEALLDGNPETTALTQDGGIILGPVSEDRLVQPESSFSAATTQGENVVVARVDENVVVVVNQAGKEKVLYEAKESMITDLLSMKNAIYVATGPSARIYRINKSGEAELFFEAEVEHIWDMTPGPKGSIFCVTGGPGQVIEISSKGKGRVLLESEQTHLRSVVYDPERGLFVGGGERGVLLHAHVGSLKKFRALYDTQQTEITSLVVHGDYVYVVGVSGAEALVTDPGTEQKGKPGPKSKATRVSSQLAEVALDGTAQILAGSNDEVLFSMVLNSRGDLLVSTGATGRADPRGRIYSINPRDRVISLVYQSPSKMITHLLHLPDEALAAVASGGGRITQIVGGYAPKGEYISAPFDIRINASFGALDLLGEFPAGTDATLALRTGQTSAPDETWSDWSGEISKGSLKAPKVPNGRYGQLRVTLKAKKGETPTVRRVRVAYLRKNLPPFVSDVFSLAKGIALVPLTRSPAKMRTVNLREKKPNAARKGKNKPGKMGTKAREVAEEGALTLRWRADDPNDDELRYGLDIQRAGNQDWKVIDDEMEVSFYTLQSSQLPDGHYRFRVRASDAFSNPVGLGLEDERESYSILIDNQPPEFARIKMSRKGNSMTARVGVSDLVGPLTDARFSLDGQRFQHLLPDDGLLDGREESFTIHLDALEPGPHTLTVRVRDSADNEAVGESVFEMK